MYVDIDIEPHNLSETELLNCVKYATERSIGVKMLEDYSDIIDCDKGYFEELLREMYEYFTK